ncbi:MAG: hypothetical protein HYU66_17200 [Armatimonadetes bacterium]|nr:hypothetical protein [Armatimonadota bacterium]
MRRSDLQADALAFMYAHEFVDQAIDESELYNPLAHDIEYPTKAPLSDQVIDRNEVAEKVIFVTLADLCAARRLVLSLRPIERVLGQHWVCRVFQLFGYPRHVLLVKRDGTFPNSPINQALNNLFDSLVVPGSDFLAEPRLPVRRLLQLLFRSRGEDRDPYNEVLQWVGEELIDEGFYFEATDVSAGVVPFRQAHPDLEKMRDVADRVALLRERLATFERREPELFGALKETVARAMKELAVLHTRRTTL